MFLTNKNDSTAKFLATIPAFKPVFDLLNRDDLDNFPLGRFDLTNQIFGVAQEFDSLPDDNGRWESHQKNIDIQFVVSGTELIKSTHLDQLIVAEDALKKNDALYYGDFKGNYSRIILRPGDFAIFLPEDAHKPCLQVADSVKVKKIVVKVPYSLVF
ncbi:hypothetical protein C5Z25_06655 [Lactobacillus sp. CBA3605]|uniref:YhcH/YjgK/YiaL family protein n=1 Tax=Lactobacillus sp. CBA3605 TaxID=2099788 RepID=UPI000CFBE18E|nr:YhcH/YjgK/YiaL family protein [Lactobacillus sp. CBA3605]AVK61466.1 hypothetical protein C5Z25_06655 [Lactobacillus sp. CBA3605]